MGYKPMVYIYKPEYAEVILKSSTNITKASTYDSLQPWLGHGLLTATGSKWFHDRKLITPSFHFSMLDNFIIVMLEKSEILIDRIEKEMEKNFGKNGVNIYPLIADFTLDVICETTMGVNIHAQDNTITGYSDNVHKYETTNSMFYRYIRPWLKLDSIFALTAEGKQFYSSIKELHRFNREVIKMKKEARREQSQDDREFDELGRKKRKSFIDILLDINENNSNQLSEKDMDEQVATIMFAGHDTTATAIFWTLLCLATEPEIQDKVYEELKDVFDTLDGSISMSTISQLEYLDRVCKETLRLYTVAPEFSRQITEEITIEYHKVFCQYTVRYKEGIYKLWMGYKPMVYIYKPEYAEIILKSSTNITKASTYDSLQPWLGHGLLTATGSKWFHDRKLITPAFHFSMLDNFIIVMLEKSEILIDRIEKEMEKNFGKNGINIYPLVSDFALDVICETTMGVNIHAQDNTFTDYSNYIHKATNSMFYRYIRPWLKLESIFALTAEGKQFYSSIKELQRFNREVIKMKKEARREQSQDDREFDELGRKKRKSFLDILLDINENNSNQLSEKDMDEQVATIISAGHDTSAASIFWTLLCLATEPEIQDKVYEELKNVFDDLDGPITMNTISKLKYLERVCKETLRLYTVAPEFSRQITEEITIEYHKVFCQYTVRYKEGIYKLWMGYKPMVYIYKPEYAEVILRSSTNITKATTYDSFKPWIGDGLITSTGSKWFYDRKLITPAFHFSMLDNFIIVMLEKSEILIDRIEKEMEKNFGKNEVNIYPLIAHFTLDVICETTMGVNIHAQDNTITGYPDYIHKSEYSILHRYLRPWLKLDSIFALTAEGKEFYSSIKEIHRFNREVIKKKKEARREQRQDDREFDELGGKKRKAFIDILLDINENNSNQFSEEELDEQVATIMFAGHDTTATAIFWTLFCLATESEIQDKVYDELKTVFDDLDGPITMNTISQLKYLDRVCKEALRLYPVIPKYSRQITEEITIEYHKVFCQYTVRYKEGIYKLWMGYKPMVYIYKPEYAEVILTSSTNITKASTYDSLQPWLGHGLLTATGSKWFHDRKLITPSFHFSMLDNFIIVMLEKSEILIDRIEKEMEKNFGKNGVNIYPLIADFTLDVICETTMGVNIHAQDNTFTGYSDYIHKGTNSMFYRYIRPWLKLDSIFALTAEGKQFYSSIKEIHRFNREVIKMKKEARREQSQDDREFEELGRKKRKSFIDILLDINENNSNQLSEKDMDEQVATIMFAGHDTTATAIFWTLLCLATEPEIQDKVYEELKDVFDNLDGSISMSTISQLEYLDRVCKETLRLYTVVPEFSRQITEEITIEYHKVFCQYTVRYKEGIYKLWMGYKPMVYIYKPEYAEVILRSSTNITKATTYDSFKPWIGDGLITSTGSKWFHDRKLITPAFHFSMLDNFIIVMLEKSEILIDRIEKEMEKNFGKNGVNIYPLIADFTLDVICETTMGVNIHAQDNTITGYPDYIHKSEYSILHRYLRPWLKLDSIFALTAEGKEFYSSIKEIHRFNREVIKMKKEARREKCQDDSEFDELGRKKRKAFIDILLDINKNDSNQFSEKDMNEQVATIMFAGHDTTATAIFWTLFCLATEPEIQDKVYDELKNVFDDLDGPITMNTISQLKYLDRVCKESLRLYAIVPVYSRQITNEIMIGKYVIPKNTELAIHVHGLHHDPEIWTEPDKFNPDRFLTNETQNRNPFSYLPFSAGPRNCIGQKFANLELKLVIAMLLRKWMVKSSISRKDIKTYHTIVLRPLDDVYFRFIPRK
ncbi:uncharacterized protein LOC124431839 [Vespa crabro]|uniref:uncharacterized protein LOC124431839 n=1 Tax=Vespa crabro TaxID=7445 RepID=UPI001F017AC4|nr:uncharacterized protein LOC124431839 [Vespa crabro]